MGKYKNIREDIENVSNKEVVKQTQVSMVAVGLLIAAVLCAVVGASYQDPNSSMPTSMFTLSGILFLGGIVKLFVSRSCYMFKPTKSRLKSVTMYFDVHESDALQACVEMKRFADLSHLKREKDSGIKLDALIANDGKFAAVQVSEYVPYTYETVTPVICYYGEEAQVLAAYVKS